MTVPLRNACTALDGLGAMTKRQVPIATQMRKVSPAGQAVANQKIDPTPTATNTRRTPTAATLSSNGADSFATNRGRLDGAAPRTSDLVCRKLRKERSSCLTFVTPANSSTLSTA